MEESGKPQTGYLLLADISGFTPYLAGVELEHAQAILAELLELIIHGLEPVFGLFQVEGDAVLAYAAAGRVQRGETALELLETVYAAFRERLESMARNTTCDCQACRALPMLDLKFLTHSGQYLEHELAGERELIGLDVMLVRERVLKDPVGQQTGWRGYALFTEPCLRDLGLAADGMHEARERYGPLGQVRTYSLDLNRRFEEMKVAKRVALTAQEADAVLHFDFAAPPARVWEWLNDPSKRTQWGRDTHWRAGRRVDGRTGPGARNHCEHGSGKATEIVLDWRPFDYYTVEVHERSGELTHTALLEPLEGGAGTRLTGYFRFKSRLPRRLRRLFGRLILTHLLKAPQGWQRMAEMMAAEPYEDREAGAL